MFQNFPKLKSILLLIQIFVVSSCSLAYELLLGTAASNITGNSVLAFSLSIGLYLAGLGTGAFCSQWVKNKILHEFFVWTETVLALVGGICVATLYLSLVFTPYFQFVQIFLTFLVGLISGLEIPVLTRILNINNHKSGDNKNTTTSSDFELKGILANVLSFDYLGGLLASVLFPLILLPYFGLVKLNFLIGLLNLCMATLGLYLFWSQIKNKIIHIFSISIIFILLLSATFWSSSIYNFIENGLYRDPIVYSTQSQFGRIVVTKKGNDTRLYLNGGIQFSSQDEYRYHESLVMPALLLSSQKPTKLNVAVFGGGDGLAVTQILKFSSFLEKVSLVDIDPKMTDLAKNSELFKNLNQNSLNSDQVQIYNRDAWAWLQEQPRNSLDLIISDLPDPDDSAIAKLYSQEFFKFASLALKADGVLVTQSSSPYTTPKVFWAENKTLSSVFPQVIPYQAYVPSFGQWGFHITSKQAKEQSDILKSLYSYQPEKEQLAILNSNQYIDTPNLTQIFTLSPDLKTPKLSTGEKIDLNSLKINTLDNLILIKYYTETGRENSQ